MDLRLCHTPGDGPTTLSGWSIKVVARTSEKDRPVERREVVLFTVSLVAFRFRIGKMAERFVGGGVAISGVLVSALDSELIFVWILSDTAMCSESLHDCTVLLLSTASQLENLFVKDITHP